MFSRTGSADFPLKLKALVSGPPKSGKTTLLGTIPNIVIADTEPHANNLQSLAHLDVPYITVNSMADLQNLRMVLSNPGLKADAAKSLGMDSIDAVAIDTLDTLQKIMKRERLLNTHQAQFLRDDWAWLKEEMIKLVEGFTQLDMHVVFTVHTKTKDIGTQENPKTIILPGLEGAISEEIAGMVGYSLLSFRKEELGTDGKPYTKYWLRAEGDDTYEFLGNRTAGKLPSVIEPDFGKIMAAALSNRPTKTHEQIQLPQLQTTGQTVQGQVVPEQPAQPAQQQPAPTPQPEQPAPAQGSGQAPEQPQTAPPAPQGDPARPSDDEPISGAAMGHVKKVYDACGLPFPEEKVKGITIGRAREVVRAWMAVQADATSGQAQEGTTPQSNMIDLLTNVFQLMPDAGDAAPEAKQVTPKVDGTVDEVKAYVGDDIAKAQEAFNKEFERGKPRSSLVTWLESKGARPTAQDQAPQVQTPVENQAPQQVQQTTPQQPQEQPAPTVTPTPAGADASTEGRPVEGQAEQKLIEQELGGQVIEGGACATCGKPIDDEDIAKLCQARFGKRLCVDDYILASRA